LAASFGLGTGPFCSNVRQSLQPLLSCGLYALCPWSTDLERAMRTVLQRFLRDENGATAIEYGLIAAGISVAIITVVNGLGTKLANTFSSIDSKLN
jgi:pilus assembly protein Flp/PilA